MDRLIRVLAGTDPELAEHGLRTAQLARRVGVELRMGRSELDLIEASGRLHDIGKLFVASEILDKPGPPTASEWVELRRHPRIGFELVRRHVSPRIAQVVLAHHERYDGTGYPSRLTTSEIPIEARVLQVADAFDAMTSVRPYQPAMSIGYAVEELTRYAGTQFDPKAVAAIVRLVEKQDRSVIPAEAVNDGAAI